MFYILSKSLDVLLSPLWWSLLLAGGAYFVKRRRTTHAIVLACAAALILLVFSSPRVSNALWRRIEPPHERLPEDARYDAVILLGGTVSHEPTQTHGLLCVNDSAERLFATYDLLKTNRARDAIVTGGTAFDGDPVNEARALAARLVSLGIDESRIVLEPNARNTRENATETARIVRERGYQKLLLVTSAFHMERSLATFRRAGLHPRPFPVDYRSYEASRLPGSWLPRAEHLAQSEKALRELFGRLVYKIVDYS